MATRIVCNDTPAELAPYSNSNTQWPQQARSPHWNKSNCYRRRLMKRLREKFQSTDSLSAASTEDPYQLTRRPTVIRVGTVSSCASSTVRSTRSNSTGTGTVNGTCTPASGTWRWDELFRRGRSVESTLSSRKSDKTVIYEYEDDEEPTKDYCTVVSVEDAVAHGHQQQCVVLVDSAPVPSAANVLMVNADEDYEAGPSVTSATAECPVDGDSSKPVGDSCTGATNGDGAQQPAAGGAGTAGAPCSGDRPQPGHHQLLAPDDLPRIYPVGAGAMGGAPCWAARVAFEDAEEEEQSKGWCCCGTGRESHSILARWLVGVIGMIGVSCVIAGIVLGALIVSGSTRLTLCLLMIGVGLVLVTVGGIAWRLTVFDDGPFWPSINCLSSRSNRRASRRRRRLRTIATSSVLGHPHSTIAYARVRSLHRGGDTMAPHHVPPPPGVPPEFLWRPPPPSYHASVQEDRLRSLFGYDLQTTIGSPPPTYRAPNDAASRRQGLPAEVISSDQSTDQPDAAIAPAEQMQQDEGASLVMHEQLQQSGAPFHPMHWPPGHAQHPHHHHLMPPFAMFPSPPPFHPAVLHQQQQQLRCAAVPVHYVRHPDATGMRMINYAGSTAAMPVAQTTEQTTNQLQLNGGSAFEGPPAELDRSPL